MASLETKLGDLKSESRAKAERAILEIREQREAFRDAIEAKSEASEAEWQKTKAMLESRWAAFETAVQTWMDAAGERIAEQKAIFDDRADAQLKAWRAMIDQLQASAEEIATARKSDVESALKTARTEAEAVATRLEALKQAGKESWSALSKALAESRTTFDRANQSAYEAFKGATD